MTYDPHDDLYERLGLTGWGSRYLTRDQVRAAARLKLMAAHPDRGGTSEAARQILDALKVLSDPVLREAYDREKDEWIPL